MSAVQKGQWLQASMHLHANDKREAKHLGGTRGTIGDGSLYRSIASHAGPNAGPGSQDKGPRTQDPAPTGCTLCSTCGAMLGHERGLSVAAGTQDSRPRNQGPGCSAQAMVPASGEHGHPHGSSHTMAPATP